MFETLHHCSVGFTSQSDTSMYCVWALCSLDWSSMIQYFEYDQTCNRKTLDFYTRLSDVRSLVVVFIFTDFHCQAWEWGESSDRPKWVGSWRSGQVHWRHRHAQWQVWVVGYCGEMCQSDTGTSVSLSLCHLVCMFVKYCLCTIGSVKTVRYTEWQGAHYSGVAWVLKWMEGQLGKCAIEEKSPLGGVPL